MLTFSTTGEISSKFPSFSRSFIREDRRLYLGFFGVEVNCGFGIFVSFVLPAFLFISDIGEV